MNLPEAFADKMRGLMGPEAFAALADSYNRPAYKGIRTNTLKADNGRMRSLFPFETEAVPWCPTGFYIGGDVRPGKQVGYYAGLYYVQEPTAMAPAEALGAEPGDRVLDLCAAPGGKSTQLACKLAGRGVLVSNEIVKNRSAVLASNMERMGIANSVILSAAPDKLVAGFAGYFNKILVDAPCSGEGMFRKDPAVLTEWRPERVTQCAARQWEILKTVDQLLAPGGELVYSTCTFSPEENEQIVERLIATDRYEVVPLALPELTDHGRPEWTATGEGQVAGTLRIMPNHAAGEGHFVAKMRKLRDAENAAVPVLRNKNKKRRSIWTRPAKKERADFHRFLKETALSLPERDLWQVGDKLFAAPEGLAPRPLEGLKMLRFGLPLGIFKTGRFEPAHALAMALMPENGGRRHEVTSADEAFAYLKGAPLRCAGFEGWTAVTWQGYPLGWGKASDGVIKNHYPKGLRIMKK
ncbi:RsmF rRNA methyltransferase first C-terminal domain-containing protein [Pseudoramibacter sp. HA2172]|uniref:RsmF rRNA methyltransferase first C-terminal domain-containing protein n=1 Tax=Pseudoramibacter faecis TaxID=3108534 RepID=UPI002E75A562|nr:RsmF rRNA methyltransferase first C-terminal domain-containing protein [Pseudoramibacter sp. HA2172]